MARLELVIGTRNYSSWSLRPWLALRMAGLDFEERRIVLYEPGYEDEVRRHSPSRKVPVLKHGDVVVWGGPARLRYHGVLPLEEGNHPRLGRQRINLTFRKVV